VPDAAGLPTLPEIRAWAQISAQVDDVQLQQVLDAEAALQGTVCAWPGVTEGARRPAPLTQSLMRRCAREIVARDNALGIMQDPEFGATRLPSWDAEISRLERPYLIQVLG
jgi:hypothetical protein